MGRGDIFHVGLDPVKGREQAGSRYVLVVTTAEFNRLGTPLVAPITQGGSFEIYAGFAVSLMGAGTITQGVVLCHQLRTLDLQSRGCRFVERAPEFIVGEVIAKISTLFD